MADVTWPGALPLGKLDWQVKPGDNLLRTKMERGPDKVRRLTSKRCDRLSQSVEFTAAQMDAFLTFLDVTTVGGSLPFSYPDYVHGTGGTMSVRFAELPSWMRDGDRFIVDYTLELI
jgi:hypothetical protein